MAVQHEVAFESAIEADLLAGGWTSGFNADYDRELALDVRGTLDVLRRGVKDHGVLLKLAYSSRRRV